MTHDPMTPLTPPSAREAAVVRVKSPWGPLAKLPMWARIAIIVVALVLVALLWQLVVVGAVVVLITAIVAVVKKTPTWLNFRNCQADDQACRQAVTHPISVADPQWWRRAKSLSPKRSRTAARSRKIGTLTAASRRLRSPASQARERSRTT